MCSASMMGMYEFLRYQVYKDLRSFCESLPVNETDVSYVPLLMLYGLWNFKASIKAVKRHLENKQIS